MTAPRPKPCAACGAAGKTFAYRGRELCDTCLEPIEEAAAQGYRGLSVAEQLAARRLAWTVPVSRPMTDADKRASSRLRIDFSDRGGGTKVRDVVSVMDGHKTVRARQRETRAIYLGDEAAIHERGKRGSGLSMHGTRKGRKL